jgi:myo-inositol-1(or 4)-monophosphatase
MSSYQQKQERPSHYITCFLANPENMAETYTLSPTELSSIYAFAIQLGKDSGAILLKGLEKRRSGEDVSESVDKLNAVDIVTATDNEVEEFIHSAVSKAYPSHAFVGEESYSQGASKDYLVTNAPTWIVDPLDGTVNFTHAFPMFCVSIALVVVNRPVIGGCFPS